MSTLRTTANTTNTPVEEKCPECFHQCWFCSSYVWMIRGECGCGAGSYGKRIKEPCPASVEEKGKACGTCGKPADKDCKNGGGIILVERRVVGSNLK